MGTRRDEKAALSREKSDLIDFSHVIDNNTSNLLNLFDPLNCETNEQYLKQRTRTNTLSSQLLESRRRDRRFQTTSSISNAKDPVRIAGDLSGVSSTRGWNHDLEAEIDRSQEEKVVQPFGKLSLQTCNPNIDLSGPRNETQAIKLKLSRKHQRSNQDISRLTERLRSFRAQYKHHDKITNPGLVYSPTLYSSKSRDMSVKIIITSTMASAPINFTCNISTTVEHLISHAVCSMFESLKDEDNMQNYMLKVTGKDEYFDSKLSLSDYAIVSHCCKFDLDVQLTLVSIENAKRPFLRTAKDDFRCKSLLCPDDLLSRSALLKFSDLNYESLNIVIDTFEKEAERLYADVTNKSTGLQPQSLLQATKAICSLMVSCETGQLTESKDNLSELCRSFKNEGEDLRDEDRYKMIEVIQHAIKKLLISMHRLLKLTSLSLPVDYDVLDLKATQDRSDSFVKSPINILKDQFSLRIHHVSQLKPDWSSRYQDFNLSISLKHGETVLHSELLTSATRVDRSFFERILFDEVITFSIQYSKLPREARVVLQLYGTEVQPVASQSHLTLTSEDLPIRRSSSSTSICSTAPMYTSSPRGSQIITNNQALETVQRKLALAVVYVFDCGLELRQGDKLLYMHPVIDNSPEDQFLETIVERNNPILVVEFKNFPPEKDIYFPIGTSIGERQGPGVKLLEFDRLDPGVRYVLETIINEKQIHERLMDDEKLLLWDNRIYLTSIPAALPKVLLSAPSWSVDDLAHIYELLDSWSPPEAVDALQLLLPSFPDAYVRKIATTWISKQHDDELCDYLPQLLQAFRYEKDLDCSLFWMLIERALKNVRVANLLYWQLKLNSHDGLFQERSETLINCLLWTCGSAFWQSIDRQEDLLRQLTRISSDIKKVRDSQRMKLLCRELEHVQDYLVDKKPTMPWAPSLEVCDIEIRSCSYFPSKTLPLKLALRSCEESCNKTIKFYTYDTIFKLGDDLRQDMLAIQMIRIMEKLWLREGLDLRIVTFDCIATNDRQGMVEMVQNADTLRKIQQNSNFLAGPFNPKAIDNYIRLWNTSELEYRTALDKFLHSCAGYSVATYILGICDRHNDNIMITNSGHLFHIDFGKFLGDAQMMGSIKRDRTPFVLTADMAYVINGGDRPSKKFQTFIELCTMGFNIIRRHRNLFLNLFSLMSSAKIHGLDSESVKYIDQMLMPKLTEAEAMAKFTRLIDDCLNSRFTQVNFFIHNLAQLRFSSNNSKQSLLSFVPKTFSITTDGEIVSLNVVHMYKKYEPEKQYYYVVRVWRREQPDTTDITRTFREFSELQMKLNCMFPGSNIHDINKSTSSFLMDIVGRSNTREIAQRRLVEIKIFLKKLLELPPQVSQCDLIYTFFHPILRDQTTNSADASIMNESSSTFGSQEYNEAQRNALYLGSNGQVKLSLSYKNSTLIIMIMHAKNLACPEGAVGPNCYAKTYLLPDPHKQTKRKTRTVRQSCHPSFMELIVYKIPLVTLKHLTLQVSIWHSELVQYKAFLGAALIPLDSIESSKEITSWYPLKNC